MKRLRESNINREKVKLRGEIGKRTKGPWQTKRNEKIKKRLGAIFATHYKHERHDSIWKTSPGL